MKLYLSPRPRYRIYGHVSDYLLFFRDFVFGSLDRGDYIDRLEAKFRDEIDVDHALCVSQDRIGIYLAVKALVESKGKRAIVLSPYTIYDIVNMVIAAGGIPKFADIRRETGNLDPDRAEELIGEETAAVLVTHLHGLECEIERFAEICQKHGVALIEDCAQALGAKVNGRLVGAFGDVGVYSFGLAKNVNCFYGGMVVCKDAEIHARMKELATRFRGGGGKWLLKRAIFAVMTDLTFHPILFPLVFFRIFRLGFLNDIEALNKRLRVEDNPVLRTKLPERYRTHLTQTQARIVLRQFDGIEAAARERIHLAGLYHRELAGISDAVLPPLRTDGSHSYLSFPLQVPDRVGLMRHLLRSGRDCAMHHYKNTADLDCFHEFHRDCPNTRATSRAAILLPCYPGYGEAEVRKTAAAIQCYFAAPRGGGTQTVERRN